MNEINLASSLNLNKSCSVADCRKKYYAKGFCEMHYARQRKSGDPHKVQMLYGVGETDTERFWNRVAITADDQRCWEWQGKPDKFGYGRVKWKKKRSLTHRVAFEIRNGYQPINCVLHNCDNPICVNPNHLYEGTYADNGRDKAIRFRAGKVLTVDDVRNIKKRLENGDVQARIAEDYKVCPMTISDIKRGKKWKFVK